MDLMAMRRWGGVFLAVLAWCLWPVQVQAQAYPCPGPGPGERMVGMTQAGPGIASVPLCVRDGPAPPPVSTDRYAAIAWHPDAADIWVDGNYVGPNNVSETEALAACNAVMGGDCTSTGQWWNSKMAIIRDRSGGFYSAWMGDGGAGRKKLLAECSAKQLLPCEVFATIGAGTDRRSPGASARKLYAASAWNSGADGYDDNKLYVASGYRVLDDAIAAAIKACGDASGHPCKLNMWTGNGFIQAYRLNGTDNTATIETSAKRAQQAAKLKCKQEGAKTCELQALFDSRKPGVFVHDYNGGGG